MSLANLSRNGPRSGLSSADSSILGGFSGVRFLLGDGFGDGFALEVDGEGDGGLFGTGDLDFGVRISGSSAF